MCLVLPMLGVPVPVPAPQAVVQPWSSGKCVDARFTGAEIAGHLSYADPGLEALEGGVCTNETRETRALHADAAEAARALIAAAKADGVSLQAASCYRSVGRQRAIFCGPIDRGQKSFAERVRWSAPPGYSEHATGYVIDFCDPAKCELETEFAQEPGGKWLAAHAPCFGFELSFPKGNAQGVGWEPWHWRYVGTPEAKAVFAAARERYPAKPGVGDGRECSRFGG
jgi:D-alanyl-D-alanine carboxypeptidase